MQKDQLLNYFANEQEEKYQCYMEKIQLEKFKILGRQRLKEQYKFLNSCKILSSKKKQTLQLSKTHGINEIWGTRMRSIVDNQIYSIFCEAPIKSIMADFWSVCYSQKVNQIYMLLPKCQKYWPQLNQQIIFEQSKISIICQKKEEINSHLDRRQIIMKGPEGERILQHVHFKSWLDGCVPEGQDICAVFQGLVKEAAKTVQNKGLLLIHCRAGIGRTGTFGAAIEAFRLVSKKDKLSLFEIVANIRLYRLYCIQTFGQYSFIQQQLKELI